MASGARAGVATRGRHGTAQLGARRRARGRGTPAILLACALGVVACTTTSPSPSDPGATASSIAVEPSASASADDAAFERVQFATSDGVELNGRLWGAGSVGVILAHGFSERTGQDDWRDFPDFLAQRGYVALTFTFRGFCDREACAGERDLGSNWRDVVAATEYLQARDVDTIFVIGASMGGLAVLRAAHQPEVRLAGVVSLSTPQWPSLYYSGEPEENDLTPERLALIEEPKLFIAGLHDVQTPEESLIRVQSVRFADDARAMFDVAREPKQLALIESGVHSSELVTWAGEAVVTQTRDLIIEFIETHAADEAP